MKNAIDRMEDQERIRFLASSCIRSNVEILQQALCSAGISQVEMHARVSRGRCLISPDADWQYARDPEDVFWPDAEIREFREDSKAVTARKPLRAAIAQVFGDMIENANPDWRSGRSVMTLRLTTETADLSTFRHRPEGVERKTCSYNLRPIDHFLGKTPVAETETGGWYRIETQAEAVAAGRLSLTAVANFYQMKINTDHVHWFAHLELGEDEPVVGVVVAAQSLSDFDRNRWPAASHVTGFRNECPYPGRAADIGMLAEAAGLHIEPNWMGRKLRDGFEAKILITYISDDASLKDFEAWRKNPNLRELAEEILEGEPQGVFDVVSVEQIPAAELASRRAAMQEFAPLLDGPLIPKAKTEAPGRILRSQMEQGWSNETLEMLGRRFIEETGMSNAFAAYLEQHAAFENEATPGDDDAPEI